MKVKEWKYPTDDKKKMTRKRWQEKMKKRHLKIKRKMRKKKRTKMTMKKK